MLSGKIHFTCTHRSTSCESLPRHFFVSAFRIDQGCKTRVPVTFQGWDADVRMLLPLYVQESFPFLLTRKSAIHRDVIAEVTDNLIHAKGFKASSKSLQQAHRQKFHSAELNYYNMLLWRRAEQLDSGTEDGFGSFEDVKGQPYKCTGHKGIAPRFIPNGLLYCGRWQVVQYKQMDLELMGCSSNIKKQKQHN